MKVAVVITVKNESRLLRNNLLYHHAIGISKAFIYFDGTSDGGRQTIGNLDFVTYEDSVDAHKYQHLDFLEKFTSQAKEHHTARQCLNTFDAIQKCKDLQFDWLISIDADELVVPDIKKEIDLKTFFKKIPVGTELVNFEVKEIVQMQLASDNIFAEAHLFKNMTNFKDQLSKNAKIVFDPFANKHERFSMWYGHTMGKSAVKVNSGLIPQNVHRFKHISKKPIKAINKGYLFHYHAYDFNDFIKKFENFKNRPNTFLSGNSVERLKLLWRDVVNKKGYSESELLDYYKNNVMFSSKELEKFQQNRPFLIKIKPCPIFSTDAVSKVFKQLAPNVK